MLNKCLYAFEVCDKIFFGVKSLLDREKIQSHLDEAADVFVFDTLGSTNDTAKELCKEQDKPLIVIADEQTNGKGRQGKTFFSPAKSGLYFSLAIKTDAPAFEFVGITCAVAVAVTRAIEELTALTPKIKWVNDIYIDNKKVCGILVQAVSDSSIVKHLIIGVGVNLSTVDFPEEIKNIAASLNVKIDRNILSAKIANNILDLIKKEPSAYIGEYRAKSNVIGREIVYFQNNTAYSATAVDIDESGGLVVESNGRKTTLTSGEISVKFPLQDK